MWRTMDADTISRIAVRQQTFLPRNPGDIFPTQWLFLIYYFNGIIIKYVLVWACKGWDAAVPSKLYARRGALERSLSGEMP